MIASRDPVLTPVNLSSLRPTQITVGLREVEEKRAHWRMLGDETGVFLGRHMIPVVLGPKRRPYVIDHHHLARALHDEGQQEVLVSVVADLHHIPAETFWRFLDNSGWLHPFDEHGERQAYEAIPKRIARLKDDPFRSLAGAVRKAGGYAKDTKPFTEFIWADYFRPHFKAKEVVRAWDATLARALILARHRKADFLPGWCGPS